MSPVEIPRFRRALLRWYDRNARIYPWRRTTNPYRIWISEVMLQQTRIAVVLPAYRRFVKAFPTLKRLAEADEESVLALWSGLGYYARARSLHRAARVLLEKGERAFPRDWNEARELPGVGAYTAAAVLSIAYGLPYAAVDGNIVRVLSRLERLPLPRANGEPYRTRAAQIFDEKRPGDWNQALMELGQTVCLPRSPACGDCPVRRYCGAYQRGEVERYPPPRKRRVAERKKVAFLLVRDRTGRILLERGAFPYLRHLWLPIHLPLSRLEPSNPRPLEPSPLGSFRHAILHRQFEVSVFDCVVSVVERRMLIRSLVPVAARRWFRPEELVTIGRSSLLTRSLRLGGYNALSF